MAEEKGLRQQGESRTILYVDNQRLTRDCVGEQLALHLPELLVETVRTVRDVSREDAMAKRFALGILNIHAARIGDPCAADALAFLAEAAPDLALVLLSDLDEPDEVAKAFKLGVRGYIPTNVPIKQAIEAIRLVSAGGTYVPPSILSLSLKPAQPEGAVGIEESQCAKTFTPRQLEVLQRLWQGKQNKTIAYDLNMCESTVKVHIRHIMKKLRARNRTQVVLLTRSLLQEHGARPGG
jgi:DNA-binding NarL/FixJ family response regulator